MISTLRDTLGKNPEDDKRIMDEINTLYKHKEYVMKNPDSLGLNLYPYLNMSITFSCF